MFYSTGSVSDSPGYAWLTTYSPCQ